jgi:BlaR1 peptidase M56
MNGLGDALAWSSIAVTLVAGAALVMERVASRRGPRAGSWVGVASVLVIIIVTPLALCPVPTFLAWRSTGSVDRSSVALFEGPSAFIETEPKYAAIAASSASSDAVGFPRLSWQSLSRRLGAGLAWGGDSIRRRHATLPTAGCILLLAGTACYLFRLLIGLWGVHDCRQKSVAIDDPELLDLADTLRIALRFAGPIDVRELPDRFCPSAAALGWRRPLVLLPASWRSWSCAERRAVLAHELAHIARADYAAGVAARFGLALYFYHPLVHWMVARLQLQQELAADAVAARIAGGKRVYLLALSRLALKTHKRLLVWPASTFLPKNGHLIRRIHMLKDKSAANDGSITLSGRAITIAVLGAVSLVAVGLRAPSVVRAADTPSAAERKPSGAAARSVQSVFDLSYVPTKTTGFVAVRPAALFQRADMKELFGALNAMIAKFVPIDVPRLESIDQATVGMEMKPPDRTKGRPGTFMLGGLMVRSVDDFDWKSLVRTLLKRFGTADSELVEVRFHGKVYYKATIIPILGPKPGFFYFPDARTAVTLDEEQIQHLITGVASAPPEYVRGDDWRQFENGLIAIAMDNRDPSWIVDESTPELEHVRVALRAANRLVCGLDGIDALNVHAIATCATDVKGQAFARAVESLLSMVRTTIDNTAINDFVAKDEEARLLATGMRYVKNLVLACKLRREAGVVELSAGSHDGLEWLGEALGLEVGQ